MSDIAAKKHRKYPLNSISDHLPAIEIFFLNCANFSVLFFVFCTVLINKCQYVKQANPDWVAVTRIFSYKYVQIFGAVLFRIGLTINGGCSFFVPETYILHVPDSCRFLNCSVSISIFCHVVRQSWPNHMAEYGNGREGGGGPFMCRYLEFMYVKSVISIDWHWHWQTESHLVEDLWTRNCLSRPPPLQPLSQSGCLCNGPNR